uniref:Chemosensory protein n=3 Tax=Nilaparvata lugens TaxID=108931 RepID=E2IGV5_NILLU|nr:chemosensory protein [Nilaparvata lugens]ASL05045.1 chemosensory protein 2 [Nilaparvata lugens]
MSKLPVTLVLMLAVFSVDCGKLYKDRYTTKFDKIDLDEALNNQRLFESYLKCLMGDKCSPDGYELREALPDALATACAKCSEAQKAGTEKVIRFLIEKRPKEYALLEKKYDPEGIYRDKYKPIAEMKGIKLD